MCQNALGDQVEDLNVTLRLAVQHALIGAVRTHLFAVTAGLGPGVLRFRFYFSPEPDEDDIEAMTIVETEVSADLPAFLIEDEFLSLADHQPEMLDFWAFMRAPDDAGDKA